MKARRVGIVGVLAVAVTLGGEASTLVHAQSYGCNIQPNQAACKTGTGGTRVTGNTGKKTGSGAGGNNANGSGNGGSNGNGNGNGAGGSNGNGNGNGAGGSNGKGKGKGAGGANAGGANANGSSPMPGKGLPVTGFGGTSQDLGASPRVAAAGTQPVVVGLASSHTGQTVTALPATGGGGTPTNPMTPWPALLATALAILGLGVRRAARFL